MAAHSTLIVLFLRAQFGIIFWHCLQNHVKRPTTIVCLVQRILLLIIFKHNYARSRCLMNYKFAPSTLTCIFKHNELELTMSSYKCVLSFKRQGWYLFVCNKKQTCHCGKAINPFVASRTGCALFSVHTLCSLYYIYLIQRENYLYNTVTH